jgi:hypothetical protein
MLGDANWLVASAKPETAVHPVAVELRPPRSAKLARDQRRQRRRRIEGSGLTSRS